MRKNTFKGKTMGRPNMPSWAPALGARKKFGLPAATPKVKSRTGTASSTVSSSSMASTAAKPATKPASSGKPNPPSWAPAHGARKKFGLPAATPKVKSSGPMPGGVARGRTSAK